MRLLPLRTVDGYSQLLRFGSFQNDHMSTRGSGPAPGSLGSVYVPLYRFATACTNLPYSDAFVRQLPLSLALWRSLLVQALPLAQIGAGAVGVNRIRRPRAFAPRTSESRIAQRDAR